jgi:hypothetical protein
MGIVLRRSCDSWLLLLMAALGGSCTKGRPAEQQVSSQVATKPPAPSASPQSPSSAVAVAAGGAAGCPAIPPAALYRRAARACTQRADGAWCWDARSAPKRAVELDSLVGVASSGIYELFLQADGKLRWSAQPSRAEERDVPPPDARLLSALPRMAQLEDDGVNVAARAEDGSVFVIFDRSFAASEEDEPKLVRKLARVPLDAPAKRLILKSGIYVALENGLIASAVADASGAVTVGALPGSPPPGVIDVANGSHHGCVLTLEGAIWCRGANEQGQLGLGKLGSAEESYRKVDLPPACAVEVWSERSFAVLRDGSLWWWGSRGLDFTPNAKPVVDVDGVLSLSYPYVRLREGGVVRLSLAPLDKPEALRFE